MKVVAATLGLIALLAIAAATGGLIIEERYQSCIAKAEARTPVYVGLASPDLFSGDTGPRSKAYGVKERRAAVARCRR